MNKRGFLLMGLGTLLIICALGLLMYNTWDENRANAAVDTLMPRLLEEIESDSASQISTSTISQSEPVPAPEVSEVTSAHVQQEDWITGAQLDTLQIEGSEYIGYLSIPGLELELPVISEWSYDALKISPARYTDPDQTHGLIIAGHNYSRHFGKLSTLVVGDPVLFTDIHGTVYSFKVSEIQELSASNVEGMLLGDWDLTLFTCTFGGVNRVTVRCTLDKAD